MEEKTITLKELEAYICIAAFYVSKEQHLNDVERDALARLAKDFYTHTFMIMLQERILLIRNI